MNASSVLSLLAQVTQLQQSEQFAEAEDLLITALVQVPEEAEIWYSLGITRLLFGNTRLAIEALVQAIQFNPKIASYHYSLGVAWSELGDIVSAGQSYANAISCDPEMIDAYLNWGNLHWKLSQFDSAEQLYQKALKINPNHFGANWNLGNVLLGQQKIQAAIDAYETAAGINPENIDFEHSYQFLKTISQDPKAVSKYFGDDLVAQNHHKLAIEHYEAAIRQGDVSSETKVSLASCYDLANQFERALSIYRILFQSHPTDINICARYLSCLQRSGYSEIALDLVSQAQKTFPEEFKFQLEGIRIFPVIYRDQTQIQFYRQNFVQGLDHLSKQISSILPENGNEALDCFLSSTNFLLAYQGCNDVKLQQQYSQIISQITSLLYPEFHRQPVLEESSSGKIRLGFVSTVMGKNQLGRYFLGWVQNLDRTIFEICIYHLDKAFTPLTQEFLDSSDLFRNQSSMDWQEAAEQILSDHLHVLIFPEVGFDPQMTLLSNLRLAPIQCTTWAHPVTSGSATIDYFLSSDWMEPEYAQEHYSESLVRLPGIGIHYSKPETPVKSLNRDYFGLAKERIVYLCCQSLFKYLPQDDWVWAAIAQQLPAAQFVFISHPSPYATVQFQERLKSAFAGYGLDSEDFCVFTSRLQEAEYMQLNLLSDIFLDSHRWSGGMTTMKAIACDLPVVTCPGEFMRGRHSYAILKTMEIEETIAENLDQYVDVAVKLGNNLAWRQEIATKMRSRQDLLFNDLNCVEALEAFLQSVVFEKLMESA